MVNTALVRIMLFFPPDQTVKHFQLYSDVEQSPFQACINNAVQCLSELQYKRRLSIYLKLHIIKYSTVSMIY